MILLADGGRDPGDRRPPTSAAAALAAVIVAVPFARGIREQLCEEVPRTHAEQREKEECRQCCETTPLEDAVVPFVERREGRDAEDAMRDLEDLVKSGFGEGIAPTDGAES